MTEEIKICFNCEHWHPEPTALDQKHQKIARKLTPKGKVPPMYGKCKAETITKEGQPFVYDMGTLAAQECKALDYDNYPLFSPVPED